jgi:hypothetical protein
MAIYRSEFGSRITTEFAGGRSLTIFLKDDVEVVGTARTLYDAYLENEPIEKRIAALEAKIADLDTPLDKVKAYQSEIKELRKMIDNFDRMAELVLAVGKGWDHYESEEAKAGGAEPLPFEDKYVRQIIPTRLIKIFNNLVGHFSLDADEGKAQASESTSLALLPTTESAPGKYPPGIADYSKTEPLPSI